MVHFYEKVHQQLCSLIRETKQKYENCDNSMFIDALIEEIYTKFKLNCLEYLENEHGYCSSLMYEDIIDDTILSFLKGLYNSCEHTCHMNYIATWASDLEV